MLDIYKELFAELKKQSLSYAVFKGISHLQEDLTSERGDIDLWMSPENADNIIACALSVGFHRVKWSSPNTPAFMFVGWDMPTGKYVMLHLHIQPVAYKKRSLLPLYFIYDSLPAPKPGKDVPVRADMSWIRQFEKNKASLTRKSTPQLLTSVLTRSKDISELGFRFSLKETLRLYAIYIRRFVFMRGRFRIISRGLIVTFTGIDGSGKSTVIHDLSQSKFLKRTQGVKVMYFGNRNFWIPGLEGAVRRYKGKKSSVIGLLVMGLSLLDRKLRVIPALIAKYRGQMVLCDRYFYDQNLDESTGKLVRNKFLNRLLTAFIAWVPARPNISFYLKLSPKAAYDRKHERDIQRLEADVDAYDKVFSRHPETIVIDAEQPLDDVLADVRRAIVARYQTRGDKS